MVMAVGVIVLLITLVISAAVATQAFQTSSKSNRDPLSVGAIQAADTGVETALYRLNALSATLSNPANSSTPCVVAGAGSGPGTIAGLSLQPTTTVGGATWCPQSASQSIGNEESFTYRMTSPLASGSEPGGVTVVTPASRIVATGTATNGPGTRSVVARVLEATQAFNPGQVAQNGLVAQQSVTVSGNAQVGRPPAAPNPPTLIPIHSNGWVKLTNNPVQCGDVYYVDSANSQLNQDCPGHTNTFTQETSPFQMPSVSVPTTNSNATMYSACTGSCSLSPSRLSNTASLTLNGNGASLALPPGAYTLCSLNIKNGSIFQIGTSTQPATAQNPVYIFIQAAGACGGVTPTVSIQGGSLVYCTSGSCGSAVSGAPNSFYIEVAGPSPAAAVTINGNSTATLAMNIIAPNSSVTVNGSSGNLLIEGGIVANSIKITGTSEYDPTAPPSNAGGPPPQYQPATYTECSATPPAAGQAPDANC